MDLIGKTLLITGAARRLGKSFAIGMAKKGANIIIHYSQSAAEALQTQQEVLEIGQKAWLLQADLNDPQQCETLMHRAFELATPDILVNSAAIFENQDFFTTTLEDWQRHLQINLTAPFLLSQQFAKRLPPENKGRIINILDWRAFRPGKDHFAYTISKASLTALTKAIAVSAAPRIIANGLALGAILPPSDGGISDDILKNVPSGRWAEESEVLEALLFLISGPEYITGEILHVDGGRHLV